VGLMLFSVGAGAGAGGEVVVGVVVVVVVVEVSGAFCSSLAQDAVKPTIATIATPPATAARRRANRDDSMLFRIYLSICPRLADI
jgi:hypothetical protein